MVVLGADPDQEQREFPETQARTSFRARPEVYELTSYFGYHPRMKMSHRHDATDVAVLNRLFSSRLKQGYTSATLKSMVDRFYQSWAADSLVPALTFSSRVVQDALLREADVVKDDPVLNWLLNGLPDTGPVEDPKGMRKALLISQDELLFRYPEVVADILRAEIGHAQTCTWFTLLDNLIKWNLGELEDSGRNLPTEMDLQRMARARVHVPPVLLTGRRSPRSVRAKQDTVPKAIASIPLDKITW